MESKGRKEEGVEKKEEWECSKEGEGVHGRKIEGRTM